MAYRSFIGFETQDGTSLKTNAILDTTTEAVIDAFLKSDGIQTGVKKANTLFIKFIRSVDIVE